MLPGGEHIYLLLYVDDMLIASRSWPEIDKLKKNLSSEFEMKDLDEAKKVLGMEIEWDRKSDKICLTQKGYLKKNCFNNNDDTKPVSTPLAPHFKLKVVMSLTTVEEHDYMSHILYASTVNSLIFAMVCTRPNLSQDVSMVRRYMHDPSRGYWEVVKWILRYTKDTIDVALVFKKDTIGKQECIRYVNSDYTGDLDKRRSTMGYVFTLS